MAITEPGSAFATRMLAASTLLPRPSKDIFDRVFLSGEGEDRVRRDLNLSVAEFQQTKSGVLRSLMAASR